MSSPNDLLPLSHIPLVPHIYEHIQEQVQQHLTTLSRPAQKALSCLAYSLLQTKDVRQNHLAQATVQATVQAVGQAGCLPSLKPDSLERRFQRFLHNPQLSHESVQEEFVQWILSGTLCGLTSSQSQEHGEHPLVLLVDETSLAEHIRVMAVCLAYQGRAIPLCWECYPANSPRCQVDIITALLGRIHRAVSKVNLTCRILVEADRGIGCSPALLKAIESLGWYYLVRVQKTVHVCLAELPPEVGTKKAKGDACIEVRFSDLLQKEGDRLPLCLGQAFKKAGWLDCGILGCFASGCKDAWCLLTNYPGATCQGYALRMWVEACFRDLKSNGWQWQRSRVREADKVSRLWLVMAVATVFALSLGTQAAEQHDLHQEVARGTVRRQSLFVLGIRLFHAIVNGRVNSNRVVWNQWPWRTKTMIPDDAFKTVVQ